MRNIFVPVDFSAHSEAAVRYAALVAARTQATVHLGHVLEFSASADFHTFYGTKALDVDRGMSAPSDAVVEKAVENTNQRLDELKQKYLAELPVRTISTTDDVKTGILSMAAESDADFIVMGSHGMTDLSDILIGSNTERVIRRAEVPVIVINKEITPIPERVAFISDFSDVYQPAFKTVRQLAKVFEADVQLARINTPNNFLSTRKAREQATEFINQAGGGDYDFINYDANSVEDGVKEYAEDLDISLIVMGSRGRTGWSRFVTPSIAEAVIHMTRTPTMTVNLNGKD